MTEYKTVFNVLQSRPPWQPQVIVVVIAVICTIAAVVAVTRYKQRKLTVGIMYALFVLVVATVYPGSGIRDMYQRAQNTYTDGEYETVEGVVTDFHPMPYSGHQNETFSVNRIQFSYSDYVLGPCFNNTASHGGPIREGLKVRIAYSGDCILKLEVSADTMPSAEARTATAEKARSDWQQQTERDPALDRMRFGFAIAALFMTAWWNVQPNRFMRFWLKPPYKPLTVIAFRLFFAANTIGATWQIVDLVRHRNRELAEYREVAAIAAAWISIIVIGVNGVEWMNRKRLKTSNQ